MSVDIDIENDELVESTEFFTAHITAGDEFVTVTSQDITVSIIDTGMCMFNACEVCVL